MQLELRKGAIQDSVRKFYGDLPPTEAAKARRAGLIAWDIETSGLNWKKDKIATCQIFVPSRDVYLVQFNGSMNTPLNLASLMNDSKVIKIFHHAMFDMRFMGFHWDMQPNNVVCTKIASKLLEPAETDHSLQRILQRYLNIHIDKDHRVSNWLIDELSKEQLEYAVSDVIYLPTLFTLLKASLERRNRWNIATKVFEFLPVRVHLDLLGAGDVYRY